MNDGELKILDNNGNALYADDLQNQHREHVREVFCPQIIGDTITFWEKKSGVTLSSEEARQAIENICGFFQILHEWAQAENVEDIQCDNAHGKAGEYKGEQYEHSH